MKLTNIKKLLIISLTLNILLLSNIVIIKIQVNRATQTNQNEWESYFRIKLVNTKSSLDNVISYSNNKTHSKYAEIYDLSNAIHSFSDLKNLSGRLKKTFQTQRFFSVNNIGTLNHIFEGMIENQDYEMNDATRSKIVDLQKGLSKIINKNNLLKDK